MINEQDQPMIPEDANAQVPPLQPEPAVYVAKPIQKKPWWPNALGIVGIVFGVGGILTGVWGIIAPFFMDWFADLIPEDQVEASGLEAMTEYTGTLVVTGIFTTLVAVMLLVGGIQLMKMKKSAINLLFAWAIAKMILVVVGILWGWALPVFYIVWFSVKKNKEEIAQWE